MFFCWFEPRAKAPEVHDEAWRMAHWWRILLFVVCGLGGLLYAAALPPLNWNFAAFISLIPVLVFISLERRWFWHFAAGWFWGWCHAVCAYQFLREIEWIIPWLLAPVMGLFPALWAVLVGFIMRPVVFPLSIDASGIDDRREYLLKGPHLGRLLVLGVSAAALFTAIEFSRSRLFVWNDLSVTQYRNTWFIQLAALTGSYGVGFCVALVNSALYVSLFRRGWRAALILLAAIAVAVAGGGMYTRMLHAANASSVVRGVWKVLAIQGDLSQRRHASIDQVEEALAVYEKLSLEALAAHPDADAAVWPESAVPIVYYSMWDLAGKPLRSEGRLYRRYQETVRRVVLSHGKPLIFGALDVEEDAFILKKKIPGTTNSALMMGGNGKLCARYDKFHRVPFGEYIPGRDLLPDSWIAAMDMGRDLVPGKRLVPWAVTVKGWGDGSFIVRPGVVICYEGVFGYVTREHVGNGANVLLAISNDAWYPHSSEPEQHLANATLRAVECGVPMIRVGNNGGSGVLTPRGTFTQVLEVPGREKRPELRRGRGYRLLEVQVVAEPCRTLFVRWGDWFPWSLVGGGLVVLALCGRRRQALLNRARKTDEVAHEKA